MALILDILNQLQLVVDYSSVIEDCFPETLSYDMLRRGYDAASQTYKNWSSHYRNEGAAIKISFRESILRQGYCSFTWMQ